MVRAQQLKCVVVKKMIITYYGGHCLMHLFRKLPMKSCKPIRANTDRQKRVRIITSFSALTDSMRAATMAFNPVLDKDKNRDLRSRNYVFTISIFAHIHLVLPILLLVHAKL